MLRKAKDLLLGLVYRRQKSKRLDVGVHRTSIPSRRNCSHCMHGGGGSSHRFRRCSAHQLIVHRGDICKRFHPEDDVWQTTLLLTTPAEELPEPRL